jgi:nucleotide-binding universal stress UspA family protein
VVSGKVVAFQRGGPRLGNILVPTDGSGLSMASALKSVEFAKRLGARIVAFHCIPPYQYPIYLGGIPFEYPSQADYDTQCRAIAERYLKLLVKAAEGQGVAAGTRIVFHGNAAQAIVEAARDEHCGLVFMGSHGRGGWSSAFLGSVTLKALTLTHLPILVDRPTAGEITHAQALMEQGSIES